MKLSTNLSVRLRGQHACVVLRQATSHYIIRYVVATSMYKNTETFTEKKYRKFFLYFFPYFFCIFSVFLYMDVANVKMNI